MSSAITQGKGGAQPSSVYLARLGSSHKKHRKGMGRRDNPGDLNWENARYFCKVIPSILIPQDVIIIFSFSSRLLGIGKEEGARGSGQPLPSARTEMANSPFPSCQPPIPNRVSPTPRASQGSASHICFLGLCSLVPPPGSMARITFNRHPQSS